VSINTTQLRALIIKPALEAIDLYSLAAEELVLGTACQESHCGHYLRQVARGGGYGPALGIFQMEPRTHDDLWDNFILHRPTLRDEISNMAGLAEDGDGASEMVWNLKYAAAMCRVHYYRVKERLPDAGDLNGQAHYWKRYYNTPLGAGKVEDYIANWNRFAVT
jgi:hypothetical protein